VKIGTVTDLNAEHLASLSVIARSGETRDIDDWLAIVAADGGIGITPEGTTAQYRRDGIVFRPLRDAPPIPVQMIWRRHDPHPSAHAAIAMLTELHRRPS